MRLRGLYQGDTERQLLLVMPARKGLGMILQHHTNNLRISQCQGRLDLHEKYQHLIHNLWRLGHCGVQGMPRAINPYYITIALYSHGNVCAVAHKFEVKLKPSHHYSTGSLSITPVGQTVESASTQFTTVSLNSAISFPHSEQLQWLYNMVQEQVWRSFNRSHRTWPPDSALGVAVAAFNALDIGFQCCICGSQTGVHTVLQVVRQIESARYEWIHARNTDQYTDAQSKQFKLCIGHISRSSYCLYDIGSRLCVSLINSHR